MAAQEVTFAGAGTLLSGTITCPGGVSACPGIVLIGGSGPSDRHGGGFLDALRDHLAGAGVVVLAYDKRGAGQSTGEWPAATVGELAQDAAAAVAALQAHPRVATGAVGVLGHSEGGWVALRLCAQLAPPRHLILNSCPAVPFAESEVFALTSAGAGPGAAAALMQQLTAAVRAGHGHTEGQRILATYQDEPWHRVLIEGGFSLDSTTWAGLGAWGGYDPSGDLARLRTPTLAIFGQDDPLVPVQASADRLERSAARTARRQRTAVFPGASHRLQIAGEFAPGYLNLLGSWCRDHQGPAAHR